MEEVRKKGEQDERMEGGIGSIVERWSEERKGRIKNRTGRKGEE